MGVTCPNRSHKWRIQLHDDDDGIPFLKGIMEVDNVFMVQLSEDAKFTACRFLGLGMAWDELGSKDQARALLGHSSHV